MKCTITRESFLPHLQKVVNIVCRKAALPILHNIKLEAGGNELKLTANCLDMNIDTVMTAEVEKEGSTTLPAGRLLDIVNRLKEKEITLECDKRFHCKITCGNASFKLLGLAPADFPEFPETETEHHLNLKNADFSRMVDQVSYATAEDDSRKILQGILFELKDQTLNVVATDGKRLALAKNEMEDCGDKSFRITLPCRAAIELKRILDSDGTMEMAFSSKYLCVKTGTVTFKSKLLEGNFPDYGHVIPAEFSRSVELTAGPLAQALELVSIPLDSNGYVALNFSAGQLGLFAESATIGEGADSLTIPYEYEEDMKFSFNPEFLREPLKFCGTDTLRFRMNDTLSPIALESNNGFLYILMPLRNK